MAHASMAPHLGVHAGGSWPEARRACPGAYWLTGGEEGAGSRAEWVASARGRRRGCCTLLRGLSHLWGREANGKAGPRGWGVLPLTTTATAAATAAAASKSEGAVATAEELPLELL